MASQCHVFEEEEGVLWMNKVIFGKVVFQQATCSAVGHWENVWLGDSLKQCKSVYARQLCMLSVGHLLPVRNEKVELHAESPSPFIILLSWPFMLYV